MIPLPHVAELSEVPAEFLGADCAALFGESRTTPRPSAATTWRPAVGGPPCIGDIGVDRLERFKALLADEDCALQMARMLYDRIYAYERIALAHGSANDALRALAVELFNVYHRGAPPALDMH